MKFTLLDSSYVCLFYEFGVFGNFSLGDILIWLDCALTIFADISRDPQRLKIIIKFANEPQNQLLRSG